MSENDVQSTPGPAVLGEAEMKAILADYYGTVARTEYGGSPEDFATLAGYIPVLVARLRAAEERERVLREALRVVAEQTEKRSLHTFPSKPSQAHSFTRGMRHAIDEVRHIAASSQRAGEGEAQP